MFPTDQAVAVVVIGDEGRVVEGLEARWHRTQALFAPTVTAVWMIRMCVVGAPAPGRFLESKQTKLCRFTKQQQKI
jgi:hypothetical protein